MRSSLCTTEQIRTAPRLHLTLSPNAWLAYEMKKRFGTDFMLVDINEIGSQDLPVLRNLFRTIRTLALTKDSVSILNKNAK